jgi:peptide-methionine (S)-S-oxide reductase
MDTAPQTESIVLGGGCFWCLEAGYLMIRGVTAVTSGYAGGFLPKPTYPAVCSGLTGHAEVVKVEFDPAVISLADILNVFWAVHDPTTPNRQGDDIGPQYRSIILYTSESQPAIIESSVKEVQALWPSPIVTEIKPLKQFYPAEAEHQRYFEKNPTKGYCQIVINPKLEKLRQKYQQLLKTNP